MCILHEAVSTRHEEEKLFPSQRDLAATGYRESDEHWLICAPTGSGKTRMGEWAIERAWSQGLRGAYVAPLRAIVEERLTDWRLRYPERSIVAFTGTDRTGSPTGDEDLLLFTPEKLAAYVSSWKTHLGWISEIGVLVVDEFHMIGDTGRGATLEALICRLIRVNPFARIVGLSATLANAPVIGKWLGARVFESTWRPVPVTHRIRRYKRPADKLDHLVEEVNKTRQDGGRSLVFVNSRRRAEQLCSQLNDHGLEAAFTHAGLDPEHQKQVHDQMRFGPLDALVATSTLEMGVNLPARKVVVYDNYAFEGATFQPLRTQRYLQFAGRAGRPGLDAAGEAVLFAPAWDDSAERMVRGKLEPVRSSLFASNHLARETLYEVSSRLSISERHLETNFARRTLWRHQGGTKNLSPVVCRLAASGLLKETRKEERVYLSHTALGKIATQMSLSPDTVVLLSRFFSEVKHPTEFDLMLVTCLAEEVTPKLGFNFEEIDHLGDVAQETSSHLLDQPVARVSDICPGCSEQALLSAVKGAILLLQHTRLEDLSTLAERFDCYPADLVSLKRNLLWIIEAAHRIFAVLNRRSYHLDHKDEETPGEPEPSLHERLAERLGLMVGYGVPKGAVSLVRIKGIGAKRAQLLCAEGVFSATELMRWPTEHLSELLEVGSKTAEAILESASRLVADSVVGVEEPLAPTPCQDTVSRQLGLIASVDPYRLRRAMELNADHVSNEAVRISGGAEPHKVTVHHEPPNRRDYVCDCADFAKGNAMCKHVLRARIALHDDAELRPMIDSLEKPRPERPLRYALGDLWMRAGRTLDRYFERTGQSDKARRR